MKHEIAMLGAACGLLVGMTLFNSTEAFAAPAAAKAKKKPVAAVTLPTAPTEAQSEETMSAEQKAKRAEEIATAGKLAFVNKQFEAALQLFEKAFLISPMAFRTIFNIARCHQELGHKELACQRFQEFLRHPGIEEEDRKDALKRIEELAEAPPPPPILLSAEPTPTVREAPTRLVISMTATGTLLVGGIVGSVLHASKVETARGIFDNIKKSDDVTAYKDAKAEAETWGTIRTTSFVLAGVSALWAGYEGWRYFKKPAAPLSWSVSPNLGTNGIVGATLTRTF